MQYYQHRPEVLEARLTSYEHDTALYAADNFAARAVALDAIQQVYQVLQVHQRDASWGRYLRPLQQQARGLEIRLRQADAAWFQALRQQIRSRTHTPETLRQLFDRYTHYRPDRAGNIHRGYDALDALVQGLLRAEQAPAVVSHREPDMVTYEPTPARVILALVDQVPMTAEAVFYDLGAGLGHVVMLVHLLTGAAACGVEIEAAYCWHAQQCAAELGLENVRFVQRDARQVDYADGDVFFLYTPFTGTLLHTVLAALAGVACHHPLTVCTFGACTFEVAQQSWLCLRRPETIHPYALAVFTSR